MISTFFRLNIIICVITFVIVSNVLKSTTENRSSIEYGTINLSNATTIFIVKNSGHQSLRVRIRFDCSFIPQLKHNYPLCSYSYARGSWQNATAEILGLDRVADAMHVAMVVAGASSARSAALSLKSLLLGLRAPEPGSPAHSHSATGLHVHLVADAIAARVLRTLFASWIPANSTHSTQVIQNICRLLSQIEHQFLRNMFSVNDGHVSLSLSLCESACGQIVTLTVAFGK